MAPAEVNKKIVKKANKMLDPVNTLNCLPEMDARNTNDGYSRSQWGNDMASKKNELEATTARYIIARNSKNKTVGYTHYRFCIDFDRPVVYCYEIQVEPEYQMKGVGSMLLQTLHKLAKNTGMKRVVATVFTFNERSLAFFHKNGYEMDESCPDENRGLDYIILSKQIA